MARGKKPRNDSASSSLEGAPVRGKRVQVSKRVRFEVFKRDKFTCQYCGRKAPDVVLHIEHIEAVSRGGTNDVINLIAACSECNAGKSNIPLSDDTAVAKQHAQLAELEERREQQQMMLKWRRGLQRINEETADQVHEQWRTLVPGYSLNESGERTLKKILRKYSVAEVIEAIETATDKHLVFEDGKPTHDSVNLAFNSIEGIARFQRFAKDNPAGAKLRYIRAITRNRFNYCPEAQALELLEDAHAAGVSLEDLTRIAKRARNWSTWQSALEDLIEKAEASSRPHGEHAQPAAQVSQPHAEPEIEIAPVQHALFSELDRLDDKGLWQLLGYAKGMALVSDAMNDLEPRNAEDSLCRSIEIGSLHEAQGLADALRLARSAVRAQRLLDLRQLNTDQVIDIISNQHPDFPMAPLFKYDEDGHLVEVVYPPPRPETGTSSVRSDEPGADHDADL